MVYHGRRPVGPDVEDTVFACRRCGTELIRTSVGSTKPDTDKKRTAAAA
jgi:hypothetical protein